MIITTPSLQSFFFNDLNEINKKSLCPIPESIIYYSSDVLEKFSLSEDFFDFSDGKAKEKILGMKLLEATQYPREEQKRIYKDVADMSLMVCGYFAESVNKKIVDTQYYSQLGKMAYARLDNCAPAFLDIPSFYSMIATSFGNLTILLNLLADKNRNGKDSTYLLSKDRTERELLMSGIHPNPTRKVS